GKQLIYLPETTGWTTASLEIKAWTIGCEITATSRRYISADHSDFLPAYSTINLFLGTKFERITTRLRLQNLTDVRYYSMANRPMPGFHFFVEWSYEPKR
ncbi:MAG: TonB-dependent receptor, partial [Bacteroidia bacterium]|nr:TonB-dependent receptor [Bacteroidia bacterium]